MADVEAITGCPNCAKLAAVVARLEARIAELEERLRADSSNSHKAPSSDPPWKPKPAQAKPTGRKPGGQPGHKGVTRPLAPLDDVDDVQERRPTECRACGGPLEGTDPRPVRRQVVDIPPIRPTITEYRLHRLRCACCGEETRGEVPPDVRAGTFGTRVRTIAALLTGAHRLSRRATEQLMSDLFGLSISLGSVSNLEAETAAGLEAPFAEARRAAEAASVCHTDETGWAERHRLAWLWVMATSAATVFLVRKSRGSDVARELLGPARAVVVTDRWSGYSWLPLARRQLCWAHLIRDFRKLAECGDPAAAGLGEALLERARKLFELWHRVRDGTLKRSSFRTYASGLRGRIRIYLEVVSGCANRRAAALARGILRLEPAMWTFVRIPGVEPTNNAAERALRPVVLWRKGSYGSRSQVGHAFVERMLTVVTTLRQHGRNVLDFLHDASVAALRKAVAPPLLPVTAGL